MHPDKTEPRIVSLDEINDTGEILVEAAQHEIDTAVPAELDENIVAGVPTPDQDLVDEIGRSFGVTYQEGEPLRIGEKEEERDKHRWELDPASSEDFRNRTADKPE